MSKPRKLDLDPYHRFSKEEWAKFRDGEPMTLNAADIERLRALTDPISLSEAEEIYLPLTRLISFYVEAAQAVHRVSTRFLGTEDTKVPFIIGVAGSVAVGKSTTARILQALLQRWKSSPKVDLVTTDGFLFPNAVLIFLLPPSWEELLQRLHRRGEDGPEVIAQRMANARVEVSKARHFDFVIINALFETALFDLKAIVHSQRLKYASLQRARPAVFAALDLL